MSYGKLPDARSRLLLLLVALVSMGAAATTSKAITVGQVDDFQDGTTEQWSGAGPEVVDDVGPNGMGDSALFVVARGFQGPASKLVTFNGGFQWDGNWTAAGVAQVAMDIRNPNQFPLAMRIGIAGPDGFGGGGFGDTHVSTNSITVPADNAWHSLIFPATAADFTSTSISNNIAAALADVRHFRILHNPAIDFIGAPVVGSFYVDNIRALAATDPLQGDYNQNGAVDAADYVVWRKTGGSEGGYGTWRTNFGRTLSDGAHFHGSALAISSVPEPASLLLLLIATVFSSAAAPRRKGPAN